MALSESPYCRHPGGCKKWAQRKGLCATHFWELKHHTIDGKYIDRNMGSEILELSRLMSIPVSKLDKVLGVGMATLYGHTEGTKSRMYKDNAERIDAILLEARRSEYIRLKNILEN